MKKLIKVFKQEIKAKAVDKQIAGYVNKMKSNVDLTGVSPEQQKAIQSYLVNQKNEYVKAANEIVNYSASDPEYMRYADIMNSVNNSFVNLSSTLKTYKANQAEFVDDFQNNRLSNGDLVRKKQAGEIYDPKTNFSIENGDFIFSTSDGKKVNFRDFKNPSEKAFKTATSIATIANTVYKAGAKLNPTQASSIRLQLEEAFNTNPDALRSIAADGFFNGQPMAINQEALNNVENTDELQTIVINQLMEGISASALQGYNDKQSKINQRSGSSTSGYKSPETKYLTSTESPTGKAGNFAIYLPKDPNGKIKYVPIGGTNNSNPTPTPTTTPTSTIDVDIMGEAEKFIKKTYPDLKEGTQEFTDKLMKKYNSLI